MNSKKTLTILVVCALAAAGIFGFAAYRTARAAANPQTATPPQAGQAGPADRLGKGGMEGVAADQYLADALGITTDQLTAAVQKADAAALDKAVAAGLITQAQADQLKSNGETFPFGGRWAGYLSQNGIDFKALLAEALGISADQLTAAQATAHNARIDAAVTAGTLTQEQADLMKGEYALQNNAAFQNSMQSAYTAAVQQAVTDGVITQAQADLILKNAQTWNSFGGHGRHGAGGPGMGDFDGGRGGRHGGDFGQGFPGQVAPSLPGQPATPSTTTPSGSNG